MSAALPLDTAPDPFALGRAWRRMKAAGFEIRVAGDSLQVSPFDSLSDSQRAYLHTHKAALVALLTDVEAIASLLATAGAVGVLEGQLPDWPWDRRYVALDVLISQSRARYVLGRYYQAAQAPVVDWEAFEERAAIMEYDGGLTRNEAEAKAMAIAVRTAELQAQGWAPWNAKARAESEVLLGLERAA